MEVSGLTTRSEATQAASPLDRKVMPLTLWQGDCLDLMAQIPDGMARGVHIRWRLGCEAVGSTVRG